MADTLMGVTEITNVSQREVMAYMVQQYLVGASMFPQRVMTFVAPQGDKSVDIPRAGGFTVGTKAENTPVDAQAITWAADNLPLSKHRVIQVLLEDIANIQSKVNQEVQISERAGLDLAYDTDVQIVTEFYSAVSTSSPDHLVAYDNSGSDDTLGDADLLNAKLLLDTQKLPQTERYLAVDPTGYSQLLALDKFVRYDAIQANQVNVGIRPGVLGTIYGFEVFMSHAITAKKQIAFHKSALAYGVQQGVTYGQQQDLANLATRHSFSQIYGVKCLDFGKRCVVIGTAS